MLCYRDKTIPVLRHGLQAYDFLYLNHISSFKCYTKLCLFFEERRNIIFKRKVQRFCTFRTLLKFKIQKLPSENILSQVNMHNNLMFTNVHYLYNSTSIHKSTVSDCIGIV